MTLDQIMKGIQYKEPEQIKTLFNKLANIKNVGYLTKSQLISILRIKSGRPLNHYQKNTEYNTRLTTELAFATNNDRLKMHILTSLYGVRYPAASTILMFYDRNRFPIIDIRAWKQLHRLELVSTNPGGINFRLEECEEYFKVIRGIAKEYGCTARAVEKRLYDYSILSQTEPRLYL
ncbi:hypothetical protein HGH93_08625 [Chitinophaga polysaccharea]|uniref:hypothetical protein n=1 Tax=Chitinophaga polysaccharea TaxID=1293035 RepID=UPI00145524F4|nr:hypothetical protein [Chitinophaga polysaccharea]NLR58159.1 hypothetical protein [Chitinophaga polysaccharea]